MSVTNLVISLFGTSLMAVPYAMAQLGVYLCAGCFVLIATLGAYSYHLLSVCVIKDHKLLEAEALAEQRATGGHVVFMSNDRPDRDNAYGAYESPHADRAAPMRKMKVPANKGLVNSPTASSYYSLAERTMPIKLLGIPFQSVVDVSIAINCAGMAVGMLIIAGDNLPEVAKKLFGLKDGDFLASRVFWVMSFGFLISLPLSFLRSLEPLKIANSVSLLMILALVVLQVLYSEDVLEPCKEGMQPEECQGNVYYWIPPGRKWYDILASVGVLVNAYNATFNVPTIAQELKRSTVARMSQVVILGMVLATGVYAISAYSCYRTWGDRIGADGDILQNFPHSTLSTTTKGLLSLVLCVCVPMMVHPSRNSVAHLVFDLEASLVTGWKYYAMTIVLFVVIFGVSVSGVNIALVLGMMGGLVVVPLLMVLPPIFYLKMHERHRTMGKYRIFAKMLAGFGTLALVSLSLGQVWAIVADPG